MTDDRWWLASTNPVRMLSVLQRHRLVSARRVRLFAVACCRRALPYLSDPRSRRAVEVAEEFAEGRLSEAAIDQAHQDAQRACWDIDRGRNGAAVDAANAAFWVSARLGGRFDADGNPLVGESADLASARNSCVHAAKALARTLGYEEEKRTQAILLRDVYPSLTPQPALNPRRLTTNVLELAQAIYEGRMFDRMPILADALVDAGCDDESILVHCRSDNPHARGCHVLDLILGKD